MIVSAFTPIIVLIGIWVAYYIRIVLHPQISRGQQKRVFASHMSLSLILAYCVLPMVIQILFNGINCAQLPSGEWYLRVDTSVQCSDWGKGTGGDKVSLHATVYRRS